MKLRVHIHHVLTGGWVVDIDDDTDRQPDDPYWCRECSSLAAALEAGCAQLRFMYGDLAAVRASGRVSGWIDPVVEAVAA
jgi:hypothetical protein